MNMFKNIILITSISFFLFFFFLEIFLIKNITSLFLLNEYLPNTAVTKEIRAELKNYELKNKMKIKLNNKNYFVFNKVKEKITNSEDVMHGASKNWFYNDQGFCNKHDDKKAEIISIGDSFTYCTAVKPEETYIYNIFENIENEKLYNYGMTGTGVYDYTNVLISKINNQTNLIVYSIYEGNDSASIINNEKNTNNSYTKKDILTHKDKRFIYNLAINNLGKFYSFNFIYAVLKRFFFPFEEKFNFKYSKIYENKIINLNIGNSDIDEVFTALDLVKDKNKEIYLEKLYTNLSKNMIESMNYANKFKTNIIFVYIPSAYSALESDQVKFDDEKIGELVLKYSKIFSSTFDKICKNNNLSCINTIKNFQKYNSQSYNLTHFPHNVHLTAKGHKIVANSIKEYICTNKFSNLLNYCE